MPRQSADDVIKLYSEAKTLRATRENDWRLASAYCLPAHYGGWQSQDTPMMLNNGTQAVKRIAYDTSGTRSLPKYMAVLERLLTPQGIRYQILRASNKELMKIRRVKLYYDELTDVLFRLRQNARGGFQVAIGETYANLGVYGTGPMYIAERKKNALFNAPMVRYHACPLRDIFVLANDEGEITAIFRRFWLNPRQFRLKWPGVEAPKSMAKEDTPNSESNYTEFVQFVTIRVGDHDPYALDARRHPISSDYLCVKDSSYVGEQQGYLSLPFIVPRVFTVSGDPYGISPAQMALPALGGASAIKKVYLKQANKAVDPVLLAHDDGVLSGEVDQRPGAVNYGGVDSQGRLLIRELPMGNFQVAEKVLEKDIDDVEDSFFVKLFTFLEERPELTATQVIEEVAEKTAMLAPTMARGQTELLQPATEREIDLMYELGIGPQIPPEMIEAKGEYDLVYTSPMAKGMYAEQVSGFFRLVETALNVVGQTGDPSVLDHFDMDSAIPEIADYQSVPARWMASADKVKEVREGRAAQAQQAELLKNAGGVAQMAKAANEMQGGGARPQ